MNEINLQDISVDAELVQEVLVHDNEVSDHIKSVNKDSKKKEV